MTTFFFFFTTILLTSALFAPPIVFIRIENIRATFLKSKLRHLFFHSSERDSVQQVTILDLAAAALNTGMAIPAALQAVEQSLGPVSDDSGSFQNPSRSIKNSRQNGRFARIVHKKETSSRILAERTLAEVAASLLMGAPWDEAWEKVAKKYRILADVLAPAWEDGAAPVPLLERTCSTLRLTHQSRAKEAAGRLGARLVAPLALCFLPAFMLLGMVPIIVLAAQQIF